MSTLPVIAVHCLVSFLQMFSDRTNWNLAPNRLSDALARRIASNTPFLDLTASNPTECGFNYGSEGILNALSNPAALRYQPVPKGLETARRAIAAYYSARDPQVPIDDIFITTSTSEAYSFTFRTLCNPGDELLIPVPSYPLFDFLAEIQDVKVIRYPLLYDHGWHIDFHALEQAVTRRTRGVIVVHPNNPTGHYVKPDAMARLNQICAARGIAIIADEVFFDFALTEDPPSSFATNSAALTFTLNGLSKLSGLPQMKVAWLIASGREPWKSQALARIEVIADTYLSVNAPAQLAIPAFLEQRHSFQRQLMARVLRNLSQLDDRLAAQTLCTRLQMEGGWYAVLRVPATRSDEDLAIELLEKSGVYIHPGHFYDFPNDGYLIVSLITAEPQFAEGVSRLLALF